jgi:large subunit ribosomal protein L18
MAENIIKRRARRIRNTLREVANPQRKRLCVTRTNTHIYAQIIDDLKGETLVSASTVDKDMRKSITSGANVAAAEAVGVELAKRAKKAGVVDVYFDRGANRYHGRVKALAEAARAGGLNF